MKIIIDECVPGIVKKNLPTAKSRLFRRWDGRE